MTREACGRSAARRAWAELLRISALFSVPGDALAGAAAVGCRPNRGTALAVGTSLCLYEAGMALNDWSDVEEDARERPGRPLPSGRISPGAALGAAVAFTGAGLGLAALAGRRSLGVAVGLAGTVWAYDLGLKHTPVAPATMATARALDLLLGATATRGRVVSARPRPFPLLSGAGLRTPVARAVGGGGLQRRSVRRPRGGVRGGVPGWGPLPGAKPCGGGVGVLAGPSGSGGGWGRGESTVARRPGAGAGPVDGGGGGVGESVTAAALLGLHTLAVTTVSRHETTGGSSTAPLAALGTVAAVTAATVWPRAGGGPADVAAQAAAGSVFAATAGRPLAHAALNPSPPLLQRAVGGGIRAMIPLQAALAARSGAPGPALAIAALAPLAGRFARKVSPT